MGGGGRVGKTGGFVEETVELGPVPKSMLVDPSEPVDPGDGNI